MTIIDQWAIVELMGHRRLAGRASEEQHFGVPMLRLEVPAADGFTTHYFGGAAPYAVHPTTEETARAVARESDPEPINRWDARRLLQAPEETATREHFQFYEDDEPAGCCDDAAAHARARREGNERPVSYIPVSAEACGFCADDTAGRAF